MKILRRSFFEAVGESGLELEVAEVFQVGSIPHPEMGATKDSRRYIRALVCPYLGAILGGLDLSLKVVGVRRRLREANPGFRSSVHNSRI